MFVIALAVVAWFLPSVALLPALMAKTTAKAVEWAPGSFWVAVMASTTAFLGIHKAEAWSGWVTLFGLLAVSNVLITWYVMDLVVRHRQSDDRKAAYYAHHEL